MHLYYSYKDKSTNFFNVDRHKHKFFLSEDSFLASTLDNVVSLRYVDPKCCKYVLYVIYDCDDDIGLVELIDLSNDLNKLQEIAISIRRDSYGLGGKCCEKKRCGKHKEKWHGWRTKFTDIVIEELKVKPFKRSYMYET